MSTLRTPHSALRTGFTLVELLIAITIFLILTGMTVVMVTNTFEAERLRAGARQVQSYLEGARDRAIYAGEPRGVRLLFDPVADNNDPRSFTVNSMVYIKPLDPETGQLTVMQNGAMPPEWTILKRQPGPGFTWRDLQLGNLVGARIRIANGATSAASDGLYYGIGRIEDIDDADGDGDPTTGDFEIEISSEYLGDTSNPTDLDFELELRNGVLPNSDPVVLPRNIVIHMTAAPSKLPAGWAPPHQRMDLLFSPRGQVTGAPAARGVLHFILCDLEDCPDGTQDEVDAFFKSPTEAEFLQLEGGIRIMTIFTRTGAVATNEVFANGDPFEYALTGEATGE